MMPLTGRTCTIISLDKATRWRTMPTVAKKHLLLMFISRTPTCKTGSATNSKCLTSTPNSCATSSLQISTSPLNFILQTTRISRYPSKMSGMPLPCRKLCFSNNHRIILNNRIMVCRRVGQVRIMAGSRCPIPFTATHC